MGRGSGGSGGAKGKTKGTKAPGERTFMKKLPKRAGGTGEWKPVTPVVRP